MGWLFRKVDQFIKANSSPDKGKILQSFCYGLKEELNEYYRQLNDQRRLTKDRMSDVVLQGKSALAGGS